MNGLDAPGDVGLDDVARWLRRSAELLGLAAADTRRAVGAVQRCWPDDRGRDWVERAGLVERQLQRDAAACAELADRVRQAAQDERGSSSADDDAAGAAPGGPRLGSTSARRVDSFRGMRIATLAEGGWNSDGR